MNSNKSKLDKKEWLYLKELNGGAAPLFGSRVGFFKKNCHRVESTGLTRGRVAMRMDNQM